MMNAVALQMPIEDFAEQWKYIQREMDLVPHIWEPWWTKEHIFHAVLAGQFQVWAAGFDGSVKLFLVTQIANYPAARILTSILMLGNSFDEVSDALWASLEQFARQEGCTRVEIVGRKGLERRLARYGLRPYGVALGCHVSQLRTQ